MAAVPLSDIQAAILRLLASHRNPESHVASATPLNHDGPRWSDGVPVLPDSGEIAIRHEGRRRGHWPSSSEIGSAMLGEGE